MAVARLLLEKGADVKAADKNGWSAFHMAASNGYEAVVRLLLEEEFDINAKDEKKDTALYLATYNGHYSVVKLLLDKGANFESPYHDQRLPEQLAADREGEVEIEAKERYKAVVRLLKAADFAALRLADQPLSDAEEVDEMFNANVVHFLTDPQRTVLHQVETIGVRKLINGHEIPSPRVGQSSFKWIHLPANNV